MIRRTKFASLAVLAALILVVHSSDSIAQIPAFPGAEGFGADSLGGRGGTLYEVTNLNDSGTGSLRAAVQASGPRIVVFRVSGTIILQSRLDIQNPYITIAGQTAPGDGIAVRDRGIVVKASHVVVRFIRSRLGDARSDQEDDAIWISVGNHVIFDHCSASWSVDETFSCSSGENTLKNVTVQWCLITESLNNSIHDKGAHGYGSLIRGSYGAAYTYHHNYYCHHRGRSPRPGNYNSISIDPQGLLFNFRNNVICNWGGSYAGYNADSDSVLKMNYVGNYLKLGVNSTLGHAFREESVNDQGYFTGNYYDGAYPADSYTLVRFPTSWTAQKIADYQNTPEFAVESVQTDDALAAYDRVLDFAGAVFPNRDSADDRLLADVVDGTGQIIDTPTQVGGWPTLNSTTPPTDDDHDGMADDWETTHGLNSGDPADGNLDRNGDGYTNVEEYLNWLVRPTVSIAVLDDSASESGDTASFIVTRTGYANLPLEVNLAASGTATAGTDYEAFSPPFATIPIGALQTTVTIVPIADRSAEPTETIVLGVGPSDDEYRLGTPV
ncbi:pectate lyase [Candidatus Sumerlaeota bacterium]|nr:pectate lyase [Candidatus Sumerlaeota bacterium]